MVFPIGSIIQGAKSLVTPFIQPLFVPLLYFTITSLGTILSVWTTGDRIQDENELLHPLQPKPYDFIVVGAGSAGCLLANRLSRKYSVLLIEAGGEPNPLQYIPGFSLFFPRFPETDWSHRSVPQKYASLNSVNAESSWSTGLGLGGTGTLNYMIHLRGHRKDFNNWAHITGDPSWSWEGVLPYFKSYEDYQVQGDNVNHGYGGDLRIEAPDFPQSAMDFVRGGVELGYPHVDLNVPFREGFDIIRYPMRRGVRQAPYKAFLEPIRFRNTLTIMKFAQVTKILFKNGNEAYGVEYDRHGRSYIAVARREVIVSSGTIGTPKVLMLSGVGPQHHLNSLNIPVVSNVPVGRNLQDHLSVYLAPFFIRPGAGFYLDRDLTIGEFIKWFTLGTGRLSNTGCEATGIFSSSYAKARGEGDWPDIQLFSYGFTMFRDGAENFARIFNLKFDELQQYSRNDVGRDSLYIIVSGARPFSRGYIELGGSSPYDRLVIDPKYLSDPGDVDLKVLLEAVKKTVYLMENTTAIGGNLQGRFTTERLPGCEHLEFRSDAYWVCFIRRYSVTIHHPVGTASMGSVVDTHLRVYGTKKLRVIDASIEPVLVVTNTQASTLMIAEKGADMILKYWDAGGPGNNYKTKPYPYLFGGGGGGYGFGAGAGNNYLWSSNGQKRDVQDSEAYRLNHTTSGGQQEKLKGVWLGQDAPPFPPTGIPSRHKIPSNKISEQVMKQKLEQSLRELQMMSELVRQNYGGQFNKENVLHPTSARGGGSGSWGNGKLSQSNVNAGGVGPKNYYNSNGNHKGNLVENDYYYDDDSEDNSASSHGKSAAAPQSQRVEKSVSKSQNAQSIYQRQQFQRHSTMGSVYSSNTVNDNAKNNIPSGRNEYNNYYYQNNLNDIGHHRRAHDDHNGFQ